MARKIIILERLDEPSDLNFNVVFWLAVKTARQIYNADSSKASKVKDATAQEIQDIKDGKIVEVLEKASFSAATPSADVRTKLVARYNELQADLDAKNPWKFFGTYWDGTVWNSGGAN